MSTFNKETKSKALMVNCSKLLNNVFSYLKRFIKISSYVEEKEAFRRNFPEKDTPANRTIWKNVTKKRKRRNMSKHQ